MRAPIILLALLTFLITHSKALKPFGDIQLFPNTQNSPSIYLFRFTLQTALPSQSYILVGMDWYASALSPHSCQLVNTSIAIKCTNLASPTFPLTVSTSDFSKFNGIFDTTKMVAIQIGSNLLQNTTYSLELHLYNVVPNIQKISPSVEMYTMSASGLIYEENPNMGAVINSKPNTQMLAVSILNSLSATQPGTTSTLRAQFTISQPISTTLSTFMFTLHEPFTFSVGSTPTLIESSLYATSPIPLYSSPSKYSHQVLTPHIFMLTFNQQFTVGRRFIVQIDQISNPFQITASNISIYSLNYNTMIPLEAFEGLYPIATASYPLTMTLGLPFNAPFQDAMQFYRYTECYVQLSIVIPYSLPEGYTIRLVFTSATYYVGTVYANIHKLAYTPVYDYSLGTSILLISGTGPIVVGTTVTVTMMIYINTNSNFRITGYIDTAAVISAFSSPAYLYEGLVESSGVAFDNFFSSFRDNIFGAGWRVQSATDFDASQVFQVIIYQDIGNTATSSGSYLKLYFPPNVQRSPSFNSSDDCRFQNNLNSCNVVFQQTATHLTMTIKATGTWAASNPNAFPYRSTINIYLRNLLFPTTTTTKVIYPIYATLYKADAVGTVVYRRAHFVSANPRQGTLSGPTINYIGNYFSSSSSNFQTYPGAIRFASTIPADMNLVVQPDEELVVSIMNYYGFNSIPTLKNMDAYPCTSNIGVSCTFYQGMSGYSQISMSQQVIIRFTDTSYTSTRFHVMIPDTPDAQRNSYFWYHLGIYNKVTKDYNYIYSNSFYRQSSYWNTSMVAQPSLTADIVGKAGSYKTNTSVNVYNPSITTGADSYVFICTQWSLFQNGVTTLSPATLSMSTPATFIGTLDQSPLAVYFYNNMYLTMIPLQYVTSTVSFTFWLDNAHMPYTYDLPNFYIYTIRRNDWRITSSNQLIMANGGTLYQSPLQSLVVTCQDNAVGVVNTYCTILFGTSNPLLASGNIRLSLSGMTVSTSTCFLYQSNGTQIPVSCASSTDNLNVTVSMSGWQFYPQDTFRLVVYGIGISNASLSQSITLYLYDPSIQFVIETGVRILTTTIAGLSYISLTEILYAYLNPLSYNKMTINFYLPRALYHDQQFAFVIGEDLSDANTEVSRLKIHITRQDGTVIYPLYYLDDVNYMIVFGFTDPSLLIESYYTMTITGISTPVSQLNAFNMIYRRTHDFAYTIVNNYANVIFPEFGTLETSSVSLVSYYNTEGYKQDMIFTITNVNNNVNDEMVWVFNFPSYYSPDLFQQDAYCTINGAQTSCQVDPTTPYQLLVTSSPVTVDAGISYTITIVGVATPRSIYANNAYPQRYIFVGVLTSASSTRYVERALLLPEQNIQSTVVGVVKVQDMLGVSTGGLYSFSSIYAQFQLICNVDITSGSHLFMDLPVQFDNLNNVAINAIILFGTTTLSTNANVLNRKVQITISSTIPADTQFQVQFPNLPTPMSPCTTEMSTMIVTVTPADRLSLTAASGIQGNSAPQLNFVANSLYISFNHDHPITITAGTYSQAIPITTNTGDAFLSNTNIQLQSTGFLFEPSTVFLPIGQKQGQFRIGADGSLVPVVYFYQGTKQEEVNTHYQITLNMNIKVTNTPVTITLPTSLDLPQGGCTEPFLIKLTNPPFSDIAITYTFDNSVYSEVDLYPNPITSSAQLDFTPTSDNRTFSFCSSSALPLGSVPLTLSISGTNYQSYTFSPSNVVTLNVVNTIPNVAPVLSLHLNNQQKSFLDVNFTNNVNGIIFYEMVLGSGVTTNTLPNMQVLTKAGSWILASPADQFTKLYNTDRDQRIAQFFQTASTTTIRIDNLHPQSPYTLCAYLINNFNLVSAPACLNLYTMSWGSALKARLTFSKTLSPQQLNNVICFFTWATGTDQRYLVNSEGNSCGNRSVANTYYKYSGSNFNLEYQSTNIYLFTNPTLIGSDPAPLAFTNLFDASGSLSTASLALAQSKFSITYMTANYVTSFNARAMTATSQTSSLSVHYSTPTYKPAIQQLKVQNVQVMGGQGIVYFVLVHYKTIIVNHTTGTTTVNIKMNKPPTVEQVINCQNWLAQTTTTCARAVYSGSAAISVTFTQVNPDSLYLIYYVVSSQYPLRPVTSTSVMSDTVVTYSWESWVKICILLLLTVMI